MLEGKNVNLRIMEKEDLPLVTEWCNNIEFGGEYLSPLQRSRAEWEKSGESLFETKVFIIEKKDGSKIGYIFHFNMLHITMGKLLEIAYALLPSERGKGYCTEATQLMVDYLFLSMNVSRVQAIVSMRNKASQRAVEKAGFTREGTIRRTIRGERDSYVYSILREEWKEPKILKRIA
ncbi:MAG: GNAT family protein [Candidatus Bathyarchaeia archaeon]